MTVARYESGDDESDNNEVKFVCFLKMILVGHVLDHVLDHMILSLLTTAL